jgi:hypothetical protein
VVEVCASSTTIFIPADVNKKVRKVHLAIVTKDHAISSMHLRAVIW